VLLNTQMIDSSLFFTEKLVEKSEEDVLEKYAN